MAGTVIGTIAASSAWTGISTAIKPAPSASGRSVQCGGRRALGQGSFCAACSASAPSVATPSTADRKAGDPRGAKHRMLIDNILERGQPDPGPHLTPIRAPRMPPWRCGILYSSNSLQRSFSVCPALLAALASGIPRLTRPRTSFDSSFQVALLRLQCGGRVLDHGPWPGTTRLAGICGSHSSPRAIRDASRRDPARAASRRDLRRTIAGGFVQTVRSLSVEPSATPSLRGRDLPNPASSHRRQSSVAG